MLRLLSIAGSDSGGGAGIQQDLRVFTVLGAYGATVITSVTSQNTQGVFSVYDLPKEHIISQLKVVIEDIKPHGIKIGMLGANAPIKEMADIIAKWKKEQEGAILVIDPVFSSKDGTDLCSKDVFFDAKETLFPLADVVCPNFHELELLFKRNFSDLDDIIRTAPSILDEFNAKHVIIKGGHIPGAVSTDVVISTDKVDVLKSTEIKSRGTHGTGCVYSSALLFYLFKHIDNIKEAALKAKRFVELGLKCFEEIGTGTFPLNSLAYLRNKVERFDVLVALEEAWQFLSNTKCADLVPEVQMNICYALPCAQSIEDCAAFPGRLVKYKDGVARISGPWFGASSHMARTVLTAMKYNPKKRCAMNIRLNVEFIERAEELGYKVGSFSRKDEPELIKQKEGSTISWGVSKVIEEMKLVPDVIYDVGDFGKEPMIRIIGDNPLHVVKKALKIGGISK